MNRVTSAAVLIPAGWRSKIYAALGVLAAAEPIILISRPEFGAWIIGIFTVAQALGFVVARSNVPRQT